MGKLPKFFWDPFRTTPMPGPALTDREFDEVNGVQQDYLKKRRPNYWTAVSSEPKLSDLQRFGRSELGGARLELDIGDRPALDAGDDSRRCAMQSGLWGAIPALSMMRLNAIESPLFPVPLFLVGFR
jgi:hypothetical protein